MRQGGKEGGREEGREEGRFRTQQQPRYRSNLGERDLTRRNLPSLPPSLPPPLPPSLSPDLVSIHRLVVEVEALKLEEEERGKGLEGKALARVLWSALWAAVLGGREGGREGGSTWLLPSSVSFLQYSSKASRTEWMVAVSLAPNGWECGRWVGERA